MNRRRLLASLGSLAAAGLAGCVGGQPAGTPTPTPDAPPRSFEVTASRCGNQVDRADVSVSDGSVVIEGTIWGNDACYTARLESVEWDGETLAVGVGAERREAAEGCAQCITEIDYRAAVELPRRPAEVVVRHRGERVTSVQP